jgi:hypothetical protein
VIVGIAWRLFCCGAAFAAGGILYLIGVALMPYEGFPSVILQPIIALVVSALCTGTAALAGLLLRTRGIREIWTPGIAFSVLLVALALLFLSEPMGLTTPYSDPDSGRSWVGPNAYAVISGYGLTLFAIANWPRFWGRPSIAQKGTP